MSAIRILVVVMCAVLVVGESDARDRRARNLFQREQPCPSTGLTRGACPGFEVDHVLPLKCGGADIPANMQWLTVEAHKRKTAHEASWCRRQR